MRKLLIGIAFIVVVLAIPGTGFSDGFWFGFGVNSGTCGYGGYSGYVPVAPVVPYYGGCSTTVVVNSWGCRPCYRNWYDRPYYGPWRGYRRYYYGGAYHPAPPAPHYGRGHHRGRTKIHINNCNNCTIYQSRRRRP